MKDELPTVALIFGGRGYEHEVSLRGAEYVFPLIDGSKYKKIPIFIKKDGTWITPLLCDIPCCPTALADEAVPTEECFPKFGIPKGGIQTESAFRKLACAFPLLHGDFGEDGVVQGALENANIPYVGCSALTSAIARDKCYVKLIANHLGIPTARWVYVTSLSPQILDEAENSIGYPMFVKPARLGSSLGAKSVKSREELIGALRHALKIGSGRALIEELIDVEKELECGYYSTKGKELFTNIGEITYSKGFYDYETKYLADTATVNAQSSITDSEVKFIQKYSECLASFLGLRGLSRIDFLRSKDGKIYFNEINTIPGFTKTSLYPRLISESGISAKELINDLISDAANLPKAVTNKNISDAWM